MSETNENVPQDVKPFLDTVDPELLARIKIELRKQVVAMLDDAVKRDAFGMAALISVRVPISKDFVENTKVICSDAADGAMVGPLGLLNGVLSETLGLLVAGKWANKTNPVTGTQETVLLGFCTYDRKIKEKSDV